MVELFRYIEQAFVIPAEDDSIDIGSDSDFQQGIREQIADGIEPGVIRDRAREFLDGILADPDRLSRMPRYQQLRTGLRAMKTPKASDIEDLVHTIFNQTPEALVQSSDFASEKRVLNDALVAIKMTTGFDRADAAAMTEMRRTMAFLEDLVAGISPLTAEEIRRRLNRPLQVPDEFLLKESGSSQPPDTPTPPPDPEKTRIEALMKEQAALQSAYDALLRIHPSQLQIATERSAAASTRKPKAAEAREEQEPVLQPTTSFVAVPQRTFNALDESVAR